MAKNPMVAKAIEEILGASKSALRKPKAVSVEVEAEGEEAPEMEGAEVEAPATEGELTPDEMEMLRKYRESMG
jgi:hypothetical protein